MSNAKGIFSKVHGNYARLYYIKKTLGLSSLPQQSLVIKDAHDYDIPLPVKMQEIILQAENHKKSIVQFPCIALNEQSFNLIRSQIWIDYQNALHIHREHLLRVFYASLNKEKIVCTPEQNFNYSRTIGIIPFRELPQLYMKLAKIRLTSMVVMTEIMGYVMATNNSQFSPCVFLGAALGTGLISTAANTANQVLEIPFDSQMTRTKNRVLVRGLMTPLHATCFGVTVFTLGTLLMAYTTNPISTVLAAGNAILYAGIYTRWKRKSILNTWIGALVGAIPPLIGYYAKTLQNVDYPSLSTNDLNYLLDLLSHMDIIGILLASLLYAWQFPHFNALSWNLRKDYCRAGYRMMSALKPALCVKTALNHSIYSLFIVCGLCIAITFRQCKSIRVNNTFEQTPSQIHNMDKSSANFFYNMHLFAKNTPLPNILLTTFMTVSTTALSLQNIRLAYAFKKWQDSQSSRKLFRYSLIYLPLTLTILLCSNCMMSQFNLPEKSTSTTQKRAVLHDS